MDLPHLLAYIVGGIAFVALGPVMLIMGIRAYRGRWKSWLTFTAKSTAKHSRLGFVFFWGGMAFTGILPALGLDSSAIPDAARAAIHGFFAVCMSIAMMHQFFLPKFLRPLLLPRWYREWEAAQFEREAQETELRRARRKRLRKLPRDERRRVRLQEKGAGEPLIIVEVDQKVEKTSRF